VVKIEVNQINRGIIADTTLAVLCDKAQETFDKFCEVSMVSPKQLWGGKMVAALDRQHPRDLFDIRNLIHEIGYSAEIKEGFIFFLLCSKRPMHELLNPNLIDQSAVFKNQFDGMTDHSFNFNDYKTTREELLRMINESLTPVDKEFLLDFSKGEPDWTNKDYSRYPAIRWMLMNINILKIQNPSKHKEQVGALKRVLSLL